MVRIGRSLKKASHSRGITTALFAFAVVLGFGACSPTAHTGSSQLKILIPKSTGIRAESSGAHLKSVDWDQACYTVNVTAVDIPNLSTTACQIPVGILAGTVPAGGTLTLDVPRGSARKLEVFLFKRPSPGSQCPTLAGTFGNLDPGSFVRVGLVPSFDASAASVSVDVNLTLPNAGDSVVTQYQLSKTCTALNTTPMTGSGVEIAHAVLSGGRYKMNATLRDSSSGLTLKGGSYVMKLGH